MNKRILIVDDETSVLNTLNRLFRNKPYDIIVATRGHDGLDILAEQPIDLIISDMRMPEMDGAEFLSLAQKRSPLTERILLTGYSDMESTVKAINDAGIFGYISKPWNVDQLLTLVENALDQTHKNKLKNRTLKRFKRENDALGEDIERKQREMAQSAEFVDHAFQKLQDSAKVTEQMLLNLLDLKLKGQRVFAQKVVGLATQLSELLNLSQDESYTFQLATRLHGVGKIGIPDSILKLSLDNMSEEQFKIYQQYPANGACTLLPYMGFQDAAQVIFEQGEYLDGSGYPNGLSGNEISKLGKLLSLLLDYAELRFCVTTGSSLDHEQTMGVIQANQHRYDTSLIPSLSSVTLEVESSDEATEMMLPLFSLREGMILNKDIYSHSGILLLSKSSMLTDALIGHLITVEQNCEHGMLVSVRFQPVTVA